MEIIVDPEDLTLGELADWEEATGLRVSEMGDGSAKALIGLVWIMKRRKDPTVTLDDVRKLKITEVTISNPTTAGAQTSS
jgi:hypothetical protein